MNYKIACDTLGIPYESDLQTFNNYTISLIKLHKYFNTFNCIKIDNMINMKVIGSNKTNKFKKIRSSLKVP